VGALVQIEDGLKERVKRLKELAEKMPLSIESARKETGEDLPPDICSQQKALAERWPEMESRLKAGPPAITGTANQDAFLKEWGEVEAGSGHNQAVSALSLQARKAGAAWLQEIVDSASALWTTI
jgi:hypothetical protein